MTELNRKLSREIPRFLDLDKRSRGRLVIVELEPPDLIAFRWKGTRRRYTAPITKLMQWTIQATVERERREKKVARGGRSMKRKPTIDMARTEALKQYQLAKRNAQMDPHPTRKAMVEWWQKQLDEFDQMVGRKKQGE